MSRKNYLFIFEKMASIWVSCASVNETLVNGTTIISQPFPKLYTIIIYKHSPVDKTWSAMLRPFLIQHLTEH